MKKIDFTHFCDDPKNKYFVVYNVMDKITYKLEVPYETTFLFDSAQINNQIYFSGGGMPKTNATSKVFFKTAARVSVNPDSMDSKNMKLKDMNIARANHTLVALNDKSLYAIGGCNDSAELAECEEYQIEKDEWIPSASLNERKMWVAVCPVAGRYLYSFGGSSNLKPKETNTIECLDTSDKSAKLWKKIDLVSGNEIVPHCFFQGTYQLAPDNILVFGGLVNKISLDTTFYFNPETKVITGGEKLTKKEAFYRSKPGLDKDKIVIVGSTDGDMHIYDIPSKKWNIMAKATWNSELETDLKSETY